MPTDPPLELTVAVALAVIPPPKVATPFKYTPISYPPVPVPPVPWTVTLPPPPAVIVPP